MTSTARKQNVDKVLAEGQTNAASTLTQEGKDALMLAPTSPNDKLGQPNQPVHRVRPRTVIDEYYDKIQAHQNISLPNEFAPVGIVRAYVVAVLHEFYAVPRDEADTVAERWQGKLGGHYRTLKSEESFTEIFGEKHGSYLWDHHKTDSMRRERDAAQTRAFLKVFGMLAIVCIACACYANYS